MIRIRRIDHINMSVRNLAASIEFYRRNFGFQMKEDHTRDAEPWAIIGIPGIAYLCMYQHQAEPPPDDAMMINHFGLALENFDEALETLRGNGVAIEYGGPVQWPRSRSIYITDPSGHEIELAEKVGGGLDE